MFVHCASDDKSEPDDKQALARAYPLGPTVAAPEFSPLPPTRQFHGRNRSHGGLTSLGNGWVALAINMRRLFQMNPHHAVLF